MINMFNIILIILNLLNILYYLESQLQLEKKQSNDIKLQLSKVLYFIFIIF